MNNLTKEEIRTGKTEVLNTRFCWLMKKGKEMPAHVLTHADMMETLGIEEELRGRLIKAVGHDFYPPDNVKEPIPSHYMKSLLKPKPKPPVDLGPKLRFKITVTSSIGCVVARQNVTVSSKSEAAMEAQKIIKNLGLKKATWKIS